MRLLSFLPALGRARLPPADLYADYVLSDHPTTQIALSRPTTLSDHPPPSGWTSPTTLGYRCRGAACAMYVLARHHLLIDRCRRWERQRVSKRL